MTKQEAGFIGSMNMCDEISNEAYKKIMCNCEVEESQLCEDAVSRAEIIHTLNTMDRYVADELTLCDTNKKYPKNEVFIVDDVYDLVAENLSSVTPQRPKGKWICHRDHCENLGVIPSGLGAYYWCSNCDCGIDVREFHRNHYNFCPNCGADMRGNNDEI